MDGSTPISNSADFIIVVGTASPTSAYVYGWSDVGNGVIDNGELFDLGLQVLITTILMQLTAFGAI